MCCGLWLERDYGRPAKELMQDPAFVERYVVNLALGLKAAVMLLNPARIVIGGGIAKAGDALFVPLRAELRRQMTAWSGARVDVVTAQLGDDSVLWGGLALALFLKQAVEGGAGVVGVARRSDVGGRVGGCGRRGRGIARHGDTRFE